MTTIRIIDRDATLCNVYIGIQLFRDAVGRIS